MRIGILLLFIIIFQNTCFTQPEHWKNWILGYPSFPQISGTSINFIDDTLIIQSLQKDMFLEGSVAVMSDVNGKLIFYSNGCYIANNQHELMKNGDQIGLGKLASIFCNSGGNPLIQGIIALPKPDSSNLYYLVYTDLQSVYSEPAGEFFPMAPANLYYSVIDMTKENGLGEVTIKNQVIISDTLSRGQIQATRNANGKDWWVIMPESHSSCYYIIKLTNNGFDSIKHQCLGTNWGDEDLTGQSVFAPNGTKYARFNDYYGLTIFDFDNNLGILSNPYNIYFNEDTFSHSGVAFSPNSRFLYCTALSKVFQFDLSNSDIEASRTLVATLNTPSNTQFPTSFHLAMLSSNGKIYIGGTNTHKHLHVINHPNCKGLECGLQQYAIEMPSYNLYGMPNFPNYGLWNDSLCITLSTDNQSTEENLITVFPNPTWDHIYINSLKPVYFELYNASGTKMLQIDINHFPYVMNISHFKPGMYFYRTTLKNNVSIAGKLIKN